MTGKMGLRRGIEITKNTFRRWARRLMRMVIQPGRHDLFASVVITAILLGPLLADPIAAQVGVTGDNSAQQVLCENMGGNISLATIITLGFGMISGYFILKFLYRTMSGLDKAGSASSSAQSTGKKQAVGGLYSLIAALLPLIVPAALGVAGIDFVSCLMPGSSGGGGLMEVPNMLVTVAETLV